MKKVISLVMAIVMIMAVTVPVFAEEIKHNDANQTVDAVVKTDTSAITGDGTYTVTYPATMNIIWGTETTGFSYSVTSQLKAGKTVSVVVDDKDNNGFEMKNAANATLAYALEGTLSGTTTGPVVTDETFNFTVKVLEADWDAAAIDTYQDTLTFTASVN